MIKVRALSTQGTAYARQAEVEPDVVVADLSEISALLLDRSVTAYEVYGDR